MYFALPLYTFSPTRVAFIKCLKCLAWDFKVHCDLCTDTLSDPDDAVGGLLAFGGLVAMIQFGSPHHGPDESSFPWDPSHSPENHYTFQLTELL